MIDDDTDTCDSPACWCNHPEPTPQQDTWNESEHERTGGPSYGVPLQEQCEQADEHIVLLEDALTKCTAVIAALMGERKDLTEQVYQAQVDAQDWQNKYNQAHKDWEKASALSEDYFGRMSQQSDTIREMVAERDNSSEAWQLEELRTRVFQLTHDNTELEIRLENAFERAERLYRRQILLTKRLRGLGPYISVPRDKFAGWVTAGRYDKN